MDKMKTKCHIVTVDGTLTANIYNEGNHLVAVQPFDSRALMEVDGLPVENEKFQKPFDSEEHLKEWVSTARDGEDVEYVDEVPEITDEDEETPIES